MTTITPQTALHERPAHDFRYPADLTEETEFFVSMPCEQCGREATLHFRRELRLAH